MEFNNPLRRMLPGTPLDRNVRIDQWYDLHAFVVARVVPTVADIERGVVSEAPGPACELLELLSEGVVPGARPRPCRLHEVARLGSGLGLGLGLGSGLGLGATHSSPGQA